MCSGDYFTWHTPISEGKQAK